ncbi:protein phosphatase [Desulfocarbo indianensis]|nr:protein phosphatase [Desulfocarbo indianensis]
MALRAVLADLERTGVEEIVCLGDLASLGPCPRRTLALLRERNIACIQGNHDEFLLEPALAEQYSSQPMITKATLWCRQRLGRDALDFLAGLPAGLQLPLGAAGKLLLFHGSPGSNQEDILAATPPEDLDAMLEGQAAQVFAGGHTHIQMLRQHKGRLMVNPGSVGIPFLEFAQGGRPRILPHAEYAVISANGGGVEVSLRRLALDKAELRRQAEASDLPLRDVLLGEYS